MVTRYQDKISGPLLDRIDMQIRVGAVAEDDLLKPSDGESSTAIAARVEQAFATQIARQGKGNHGLSTTEIDAYCKPDTAGEQLLRTAMARAYHRVLKVARTIADLADAETVAHAHVAEAIQYRRAFREK
jgi:magnesium chelatase family protein